MAAGYETLIIGGADESDAGIAELRQQLDQSYQLHFCQDLVAATATAAELQLKVILVRAGAIGIDGAIELCRQIKADDQTRDVPLVMLVDEDNLSKRMEAYEAGCDDFIDNTSMEVRTRLDRIVFNKLANDQLKMQLQQANEMAFIAMSDTSDLGVNVQFLLDCAHCDNLDELGMRLFKAIQSYGLNCSLQLRSRHGVKNMEANGMAKEMETVLIDKCKDQGRYVDFGKRSIMNYEGVSLLVKNMPVDDEKKYGAIKDNVFSLLQGAHARVEALDNMATMKLESALIKSMAAKMRELMADVDESYQGVMRDIADVVENMADGVENTIQFLGMDETQESALQKIIESGIVDTNRIFNEGMRMDQGLHDFLGEVDGLLKSGDPEKIRRLLEKNSNTGAARDIPDSSCTSSEL